MILKALILLMTVYRFYKMSPIDLNVSQNSVAPIHNRLFFRLFQASNTLDRQCQKELGIS